MGDRYIITVTCKGCGYTDDDVYYAPTCGFTDWKCPECDVVVDLEELTGISYDDASNLTEISEIIENM
ncbi:hypothetical protein LCGC14_2205010, partial [marine sediment metagenome]